MYYDSVNGFFFVTETETDVDPATGSLGPGSHIFIAVIANDLSTVSVFSLDATNDGDAVFGACPCFGDQPLIETDHFVPRNELIKETLAWLDRCGDRGSSQTA